MCLDSTGIGRSAWASVPATPSGKRDAGAGKAFALMCALSAAMVGLTNIPILIYNKEIGAFLR